MLTNEDILARKKGFLKEKKYIKEKQINLKARVFDTYHNLLKHRGLEGLTKGTKLLDLGSADLAFVNISKKRGLDASGLDIDDAFLKEEDKIIFEGYPGEEVIIDGTVALNDNSSNWVGPYSHTLDNGTSISIYKTVIDFDNISREIMTPVDDNITQVFVNGRYMIPALPMNIKNPTDPTTGNPNNPEPGTIWARIGRSPFKYPASDTTTWGPDADPRKGNHDWY